MLFMRPAKPEDFEELEIEYDHGRYMSKEVKQLIEQDLLKEAITLCRQETWFGLLEAKKHCLSYQRYVLAKRDFESGKPVFVSY